jgi:hypothetical protein
MVSSLKIGSLAALVLIAAVPASVPASASSYLLTFSEFPVGTVITNQYAADGITFSALTGNAPIIANDGAMPDSPVLSPNPRMLVISSGRLPMALQAYSSIPGIGTLLALESSMSTAQRVCYWLRLRTLAQGSNTLT